MKEWTGVLIEVDEPFIGKRKKPGWKCPNCGMMFGMIDLPKECFKCGWKPGDEKKEKNN